VLPIFSAPCFGRTSATRVDDRGRPVRKPDLRDHDRRPRVADVEDVDIAGSLLLVIGADEVGLARLLPHEDAVVAVDAALEARRRVARRLDERHRHERVRHVVERDVDDVHAAAIVGGAAGRELRQIRVVPQRRNVCDHPRPCVGDARLPDQLDVRAGRRQVPAGVAVLMTLDDAVASIASSRWAAALSVIASNAIAAAASNRTLLDSPLFRGALKKARGV
jgi:hypothetical protein